MNHQFQAYEEGPEFDPDPVLPPKLSWLGMLLTSRRFFVAVLGLLIVIIQSFVPDFYLDVDHCVSLVIVVATYVVSLSLDPGAGWRGLLKSRKFWAALIGLAVTILDALHVVFPVALTPEQLVSIALLLGGYISSIALEKNYLTISGA